MKIRHERPASDLSFQVRAPLGLELVTGEQLTLTEWSLEGFEFPGKSDVLPKEAKLSIPFQGVDIRFPVTLVQKPGTQHLTFEGLTGRQRETLAVFYRSLLSGKMAATDEIITSLDTPVDLVPMGETDEEKSKATAGKSPRSLRAMMTVAMYIVIACMVAYTVGSGIYGKMATIQIYNARIEAPLQPHRTGEAAFVDDILVAAGDRVSQGDVLIALSTPDSSAAIDDVRDRIRRQEDRLEEAERLAASLGGRIAEAREALIGRVAQLPPERHVAGEEALEAFDGRYAAEHQDLFAAHATALREVEAVLSELRRLRRDRGRLRNAADAMNIIAGQDGIVGEVLVFEGEFVPRGEVAVVLEAAEPRIVRGWLDQSMATVVHPGMQASITFDTFDGRRTHQGVIAGLEAGVDRDFSSEFGMLTTIRVTDLTPEETREALPHLAAVEVHASRRWASRLRRMIRSIPIFSQEAGDV